MHHKEDRTYLLSTNLRKILSNSKDGKKWIKTVLDVNGAPKSGVLKNGLITHWKLSEFLVSDGVNFQSVIKPNPVLALSNAP